jgi:hypothetical protein
MLQDVTDPSTGQVVGKKLSSWFAKNKSVLKKFGIDDYFSDIQKATQTADAAQTAVKEFERSAAARVLNADPTRAIANAIKGNNTGQVAKDLLNQIGENPAAVKGLQRAFADHIIDAAETTAKTIKNDPKLSPAAFTRLMKKYRPAMEVLYANEPMKLKAIDNMQQAYQIMARDTYSPIGAGSDTAEILSTFISKAGGIASNLSPKAKVIQVIFGVFERIGDRKANAILNQILFDPEAARTMQHILNGRVDISQVEKVINTKIVSLLDYRRTGIAQAAAGAGVTTRDGNNN